MKICDNGIIRDMTQEEIEGITDLQNPEELTDSSEALSIILGEPID